MKELKDNGFNPEKKFNSLACEKQETSFHSENIIILEVENFLSCFPYTYHILDFDVKFNHYFP